MRSMNLKRVEDGSERQGQLPCMQCGMSDKNKVEEENKADEKEGEDEEGE